LYATWPLDAKARLHGRVERLGQEAHDHSLQPDPVAIQRWQIGCEEPFDRHSVSQGNIPGIADQLADDANHLQRPSVGELGLDRSLQTPDRFAAAELAAPASGHLAGDLPLIVVFFEFADVARGPCEARDSADCRFRRGSETPDESMP
jgi:hypothetical protein